MKPLSEIPSTECSCRICRNMCKRPCWGTPEDIEKLIEAGHGGKLMLDYYFNSPRENDHTTFLLAPALKGYEGKCAPYVPHTEAGCTFWKYGKCVLHNNKLKPLGGKLAHHSQNNMINEQVMSTWETDKGKYLVKQWCGERGIEIKEPEPNKEDVA